MFAKQIIFFSVLLCLIEVLPGCTEGQSKKTNEISKVESVSNNTIPASGYDLENPLIINLNDELAEISGNAFYAKDTSVFAISDDNGYLFKIHLTTKNPLIEKWKFAKKHDFEDVVLHDSTFYVLNSNGHIYSLNFSPEGDSLLVLKSTLGESEKNEFESMYYDDSLQNLVLICKDCKDDNKSTVTAWSYDPKTDTYNSSIFKINVKDIERISGQKKMKFKPSAATINPETKDVWILSSINRMIVVIDRQGSVKDVYPLKSDRMRQPEGITFTPWGDLILSSEAGDKYGKGSLFIFKKQTNQK